MAKGANVEVRGLSRFEAVDNLFVSGTLTTSGSIQLGQSVVDGDSDLILSSSATSQVAVSGTLTFPSTGQQAHIVSNGTHLILSSSVSMVKVSGNFDVIGTLTNNGAAVGSSGLDIQIFTGSAGTYTWTKPTGAKTVEVYLIAAGGGGGGGASRTGTSGAGGNGGTGGCLVLTRI